jgi:KipI family sensor histidine kinase inhibitor
MKIIPASDSSLLIVFGNVISPTLHERVMALFHACQTWHDPRLRNLHPGYASLLIDFDPLRLTPDELSSRVEQAAVASDSVAKTRVNVVTIPVCYDLEFGPDLADVAEQVALSRDEVVRQHSTPTYLVYFLGFSPGFVYLGGLPEALHMPRLATPRPSVVRGSVGIAGSQTGIYPIDSPGGWRLIGRTPLNMFDPQATPPTRLQPGDRMKFSPIDRATFENLQRAAEAPLK